MKIWVSYLGWAGCQCCQVLPVARVPVEAAGSASTPLRRSIASVQVLEQLLTTVVASGLPLPALGIWGCGDGKAGELPATMAVGWP